MKKILQISILCVFVFSVVSVHAGDKVSKGIRAGWQYSNLYKDGSSLVDDPMSSFYVGIFGYQKLLKSKLLQIGSGLTYYQVGSKKDDDNKIKLHYLNLPVNLKVQVGPVYGFVGLNGALKLGGEAYLLGIKSDVSDFSTFDAGAFVGLGVNVLMLGIEVKYDWGLVDVNNGYKTQYFQAGLTVSF
jgi:hypothetical protein